MRMPPRPDEPDFTRPDGVYGRPERAAAEIQSRTRNTWICWFGRFTGSSWGVPRHPHPWRGLVEARTPVDLLVRIREVDARHDMTDMTGTPRRRPESP